MKIAIGSGHTAIELKNIIEGFVGGRNYEVIDLGTNSVESCDYPIYGERVGWAVADDQADLGVVIRNVGVDISLAANKVKGIRACVYSEPYAAKLSRMYNNSDVPAFGTRVVGNELAKMITEVWLDAKFEGGRRKRRASTIMEAENRQGVDNTRVFLAEPVYEPKFGIIIYCSRKAPVCFFPLAWEKIAGTFKYLVDGESRAKFPTSVGVPSRHCIF